MEDTATDARDKLIVRTLADTGMRVGELLGLRKDARTQARTPTTKQYWLRVIGKGDRSATSTSNRPCSAPEATTCEHGSPADCEFIFPAASGRAYLGSWRLTRSGIDQLVRKLAASRP